MGFDQDGMETYRVAGSGNVCAECIRNPALISVIEDNLESKDCTYCKRRSTKLIAAPLQAVVDHMAECITREYTDPANELPYESREGGYQGSTMDSYELLEEVGFEAEWEHLRNYVAYAFSDHDWCRSNYYAASQLERLEWGWDDFKKVIKHKRRFTFWDVEPDADDFSNEQIGAGHVLSILGRSVRAARLIKMLPKGSSFWRVRVHDEKITLDRDEHLSPPRRECAKQSNRMSPAGISMFYGSLDFETAALETVDIKRRKGKVVTGVMFKSNRRLKILDLTQLPSIPDFFDQSGDDIRETLSFLHGFVHDVSKPIERGDSEHVEYAPTQAFTEYVRYQLSKKPCDGICYRSSRNGKNCYVLFFEQGDCVTPTPYGSKHVMEFDKTTLRSESVSNLAPKLKKMATKYQSRPRWRS